MDTVDWFSYQARVIEGTIRLVEIAVYGTKNANIQNKRLSNVEEPEADKLEAIEKVKTDKLETLNKDKKTWSDKLNDMKIAYKEAKTFDGRIVTPNLKATAWQRFTDSFVEDNPYSQEDDSMRQEARKQLDYWSKQPLETKPSATASSSTIMGKDDSEMLLIPAGEFEMGSNDGNPDEKPVHTVYLDAFYMDVYEVTNAQYKKFMDATGYKAPSYWNDPNYNAPNNPVVGVSWNDANAYANWAGKRLPTEEEFEKAAGGLTDKKYPYGDSITHDNANYSGTGVRDKWEYLSPVGSFAPNGYGLYDVIGNAWEWCSDWYDGNHYTNSLKSSPTGPSSEQWWVLRGGSWSYRIGGMLTGRSSLSPTYVNCLIGFRCVQDVPK